MFREMRRNKQAISYQESAGILETGSFGVLAVSGDEGYPYAVPLSYVFDRDCETIYFHCAVSGHKLDAINNSAKVSFCVVDQDQVVPEEYTTYYRSVIAFGKISVIEDDAEKMAAADKLAVKYAPDDSRDNRLKEIQESFDRMHMLKLQIEHMTGKEARELKNT